MKLRQRIFKFFWFKLFALFFLVLLVVSYSRIFAISEPYQPGGTLEPACAPGTEFCTVDISGGLMTYPNPGIPLSSGSSWGTSITDNSANWNTAYGWGNHALAGYVTGSPWTSMGYITDGNTGWDNSYGFITNNISSDININGLTVGRGSGNGITNTALGVNSLLNNTTGMFNIAIGNDTLAHNITGESNISIGSSSMSLASDAYNNIAIGSATLFNSAVAPHDNVAIGTMAMNSAGSSFGNIAIGTNVGIIGLGNENTIVGNKAGQNYYSNNSIFIGNNAGFYESDSNKLIIDSLDRTSKVLSREGALIYGSIDSVVSNQILSLGGGGKVGVNNSLPTARFHLPAGSATSGTAPLKLTAGTNLATTEAGAIEYDGSHLYFTATNAGPRHQLDQQIINNAVISSLVAANSSNTIDNGAHAQEWQWNSLGSGAGLTLSSNSTQASGDTQKLLSVMLTGANTNPQMTTSGYFSNGKTGIDSINLGAYFEAKDGDFNISGYFKGAALPTDYGIVVNGNSKLGGEYNFAYIDYNGNFVLSGEADYLVDGNKYAFRYSGDPSYGLIYNQADVEYQFTGGNDLPSFSIGGDNGNLESIGNIFLTSSDLGAGEAGHYLTVGRNSNALGTSAGSVNFINKNGTDGFVWQDAAGNMRINSWAPIDSNDTAGVVIGSQTSARETKQDIKDYTNYSGALAMIVDAPLHTFRYKKEVAGYGQTSALAKERIGFIADEVSPAFMVGNVIDQVSVNGILMAAIKELDLKIEQIKVEESHVNISSTMTNFFDTVVSEVKEGLAYFKNIVVEKLIVGHPDRRTGITLYDEITGAPYCLSIASGLTKTTAGECQVYSSAISEPTELSDTSEIEINNPEGSSVLETTASSEYTASLTLDQDENNNPSDSSLDLLLTPEINQNNSENSLTSNLNDDDLSAAENLDSEVDKNMTP